jgi:hypothetical protein
MTCTIGSSYTIQADDILFDIAQRELGDGNRWHEIMKPDGTPFTEKEAENLQEGQEICLPKNQAPSPGKSKEELFKFDKYRIWRFSGQTTFFFKSGMTIDIDGSPRAYHPDDAGLSEEEHDKRGKGLDYLKHAGDKGHWWGIVTDKDGNPIVQKKGDPFPGFYISTTALYDETKDEADPKHYVNSEEIPFIVLPQNNNEEFLKKAKVKLGDFAAVYNGKNGKLAFAIFADTSEFFAGGEKKIRFGEGSIALADQLGINSSRKGGVDSGVLFIVFPGSGNGQPRSVKEIEREAKKRFEEWGGIAQAKACFEELSEGVTSKQKA